MLDIIDEAIKNLKDLKIQKDELLSDIISEWIEIWNLEKTIDEEDRIRSEITDIEEQIKKFENSGIAGALAVKQKGEAEKKIVEDYVQERKDATEQIQEAIHK